MKKPMKKAVKFDKKKVAKKVAKKSFKKAAPVVAKDEFDGKADLLNSPLSRLAMSEDVRTKLKGFATIADLIANDLDEIETGCGLTINERASLEREVLSRGLRFPLPSSRKPEFKAPPPLDMATVKPDSAIESFMQTEGAAMLISGKSPVDSAIEHLRVHGEFLKNRPTLVECMDAAKNLRAFVDWAATMGGKADDVSIKILNWLDGGAI